MLDVLLSREPWLAESQRVWKACDDGLATGYLVASTLTDIYYIARKTVGRDVALQAVEVCLDTFVICPLNRSIVEQALRLVGPDFEDNVQIAAAESSGLDVIVTRNADDFLYTSLTVLSPSAFAQSLR